MFKLICFLSLSFLHSVLADDRIEELSKRIKILEQQQEDLLAEISENTPKVNSFLKDNFTLGGFYEPSYTIIQGPNTPFQAVSSSNILGLNFSADFTNRLKFVGQVLTGLTIPLQNPNNDPRAANFGLSKTRRFGTYFFGAVLTQGYLDYSFNDTLAIQGGQGYAPFGYAPQQRELVLYVRRGGPQLLRTSELFSPLWSGFHLYQNYRPGKHRIGYNLYSFTKPEDTRVPGVGGRVWMQTPEEKLTTGFSIQVAKYYGHAEETLGWDIHTQLNNFVLTAEYARHLTIGNGDTWTYYFEPSLFVFKEEVLLYTFIDYAESTFNKTGIGSNTIFDPYQKYEYGLGVNWLPTSYTRLRLGYTYYNYSHGNAIILGQNRDFWGVDISAGVAF